MKSNKKLHPAWEIDASPMKIILRKAVPEDLDFMIHIELDPQNQKFTLYEELPQKADLERLISNETDLKNDCQSRFVLQVGEMAAGLADLYEVNLIEGFAWIGIIIDAANRKSSLGTKCLLLLENLAREAGIQYLHAMIHPLNFPAMALFRGSGYTPYQDNKNIGFSLMKKDIRETLPLPS